MAITSRRDRLSPPLMHAFRSAYAARDSKKAVDLRDESGERVIAGRRSVGRFPITELQLRREVARDLDSLMNTVALESAEDIREFGFVRKSILNFGLPDIGHRMLDEGSTDDVRNEIQNVLMNYEPRIDRNSIRISRDTSVQSHELKIRFIVRAELFCEPVNVPVEFVADLDVDVGSIQINRL
jgi:type VI secretion system protein ImpF